MVCVSCDRLQRSVDGVCGLQRSVDGVYGL